MTYRYHGVPCIAALILLASCSNDAPSSSAASSQPAPAATASIQDLMLKQIEPAAEALWNSVSTTVSESGVEEKRPETAEQWAEVRAQAMLLMEAARDLKADDLKVLSPGQQMADEGVQGVLPAHEVQTKIDANRAQFNQFADLLHEVGGRMQKAIDAQDIQGMLNAGEAIDAACESCHLTFWYPNQVIPELPQ